MLPSEASSMRPKFLGSDYRVRERREITAAARGPRTSFSKTFLGAVVVVAATVAIPVFYGQVTGEKRTEGAAGSTRSFGHSSRPTAAATTGPTGVVTGMPMSPRRAEPGQGVNAFPDPTPGRDNRQPDLPVATPLALIGVADAADKASATPNPVAAKRPDRPRVATVRKVVSVRHHQPHRVDPSADFFTTISKFGRSRELGAALQLLL
jgi:hypothetical protein